MGRVYLWDIAPLTLQLAGLAALQQIAAPGNLTLTAGTGVTRVRLANGTDMYVLDVPRVVTISSAGAFGAVSFTVSGFDAYGQSMTQTLAGPANSTVSTLKAFRAVTQVSSDTLLGTNTRVGYGDVFGLPVRVISAPYILTVKWNVTLAQDGGTFVPAVVTSPSTDALGDVRGTYAPSDAADGTKRLVMAIGVPAIGSGPNATRIGAFGVTQV